MGVMQPLTQKTEPQKSSRAADMAQGKRDGGSFPSLCLAVRVLGGCLGQKSPHTLKWCWAKIPDDTQLIVNLVLLHNTTDQSSDQKGFGNCMGSGGQRRGRPKKEIKGEMQGSHCHRVTAGHHSHCSETTAFISAHQQRQAHMDPLKTLLWCNRPLLPEQAC